jgi:hemerythrin-like domain-containing protein
MRTRRSFLAEAPIALAVAACNPGARSPHDERHDEKKGEEDLPPTEDLMREHGLLARVLVIYDEAERRLADGSPLPVDAVAKSASIVRRFVEDYHEKQEEEDLFPRLARRADLAPLVATLKKQHDVGRTLTTTILDLAVPATLADAAAKKRLGATLASFTRMYRPHAAQEDTVVFPAFREMLSEKELDELGEKFEGRERGLLGDKGFERIRDEIAAIEKQLGLGDLARFTPTAST